MGARKERQDDESPGLSPEDEPCRGPRLPTRSGSLANDGHHLWPDVICPPLRRFGEIDGHLQPFLLPQESTQQRDFEGLALGRQECPVEHDEEGDGT